MSHPAHGPDRHPRAGARLLHFWHYAFAFLFTLLFHFPLASPVGGMTGEWDDIYTLHAPYRQICADAVRHGRLPEWTDALFCGFPFFSASEVAFFFPSNLLLALAGFFPDTQNKVDYYVLGHLIFLALASTFLARSFGLSRFAAVVAALVCSYNGYICQHIGHVNLYQTIACGMMAAGLLRRMPLAGPGALRYAVGAGLFLGAAILPGHSQTVMYLFYATGFGTVIGAILLWFTQRDAKVSGRLLLYAGVAVLLAFLSAAVQLLPTVKLLAVCERLDLPRAIASANGGDIRQLASFLLPGFYKLLPWELDAPLFFRPSGFLWLGSVPVERFYPLGLTAFVLGIVGYIGHFRKSTVQALFWVSVFLVACSFTTNPTLYWLLYNYLPGIKVVRIPARLLWIFFCLWSLLAGYGCDALFTRTYSPACRRIALRGILIVLLSALAAAAAFFFARYVSGDWTKAFLRMFVIDPEPGVRAQLENNIPVLVRAIHRQLIFGGIILVCIMGLLALSGSIRSNAMRTTARAGLVTVLALELALYGFCLNYSPFPSPGNGYPPSAFTALHPARPPAGRVHTLSPAYRTGAINLAGITGPKLATGYCATVPNWTSAMMSWVIPPWRLPLDETLLDLTCVSDIIYPIYRKRVQLSGNSVSVYDAGGTLLQPASSSGFQKGYPSTMVLSSGTTEVVKAIHFLGATSGSLEFGDGLLVGKLEVISTGTAARHSFDMRLGANISDLDHDTFLPEYAAQHSRATVGYKQLVNMMADYAAQRDICRTSFALDPPTSISEIQITALASPVDLYVSQVLLETTTGTRALRPRISAAFRDIRPGNPKWRVLHRDNPPPLARLLPTAHPSSYKRMNHVTARLVSPGYNANRDLFVNRAEFTTSALGNLNAPQPESFRGAANILPTDNPARIQIHTDSNQRGWLFFSQSWYPGWTATMDGRTQQVVRTNGAFLGMPVPAGRHTIQMSFNTPWLITGSVISGLSVSAGFLCLLLSGRRKPRHPFTS
ncbi:MAG: YfhO family protein [Candidatus Sumerlaeaceae bacterium]